MKIVGDNPGLKKLAKHLLGMHAFVRRETKKFLKVLAEAERDAQVEAIQAQVDVDGAALKPNSPVWRDYKIKKYGSTKVLFEKGWLADAANWIVKVINRRAGFTESIVYPKAMKRIIGYLRLKGYETSFGIHKQITEWHFEGTLAIGQEAIERFDKAKMKMSESWRGRGRVTRRRSS